MSEQLSSSPPGSLNNNHYNMSNTQSIADYLAQLLKDKKQLAAFPNLFLHVERLLDEGKPNISDPMLWENVKFRHGSRVRQERTESFKIGIWQMSVRPCLTISVFSEIF